MDSQAKKNNNNNNPTYFQLCLPQGWAQAEKWWETISLSCHQNHECFNTPKLSLTCHRADTVVIRRITPYLPHSCLQWRSYHDSCLSFQVYISLSQVLGTRSWSWTSHLICHSDSSSECLSQALKSGCKHFHSFAKANSTHFSPLICRYLSPWLEGRARVTEAWRRC